MSYDDDDIDELFERAKRAYRRETEREQQRIRRDSSHAESWTQSVIGWLLAIANVFATVWQSCCYITTAVTKHLGLPDNCHYLKVLRRFRTTYIIGSGRADRIADLDHYYRIAPCVVAAIELRSDANDIWDAVATTVRESVDAIENGDDAQAYELFKRDILGLHDRLTSSQGIDDEA